MEGSSECGEVGVIHGASGLATNTLLYVLEEERVVERVEVDA